MVLEVLWNPRGDYGFNRCLERTRTTTTPPTKTNTLHYGTNQKNSLFCCVCFSSRLSYHFCLLYIFFVLKKVERVFLKCTFFSFRLWWKESTLGYSQFRWEEGNFNTLMGSEAPFWITRRKCWFGKIFHHWIQQKRRPIYCYIWPVLRSRCV